MAIFRAPSLSPIIAVLLASCGLLLREDFDGLCPPECDDTHAGRSSEEQGGAVATDGGGGGGRARGAQGGSNDNGESGGKLGGGDDVGESGGVGNGGGGGGAGGQSGGVGNSGGGSGTGGGGAGQSNTGGGGPATGGGGSSSGGSSSGGSSNGGSSSGGSGPGRPPPHCYLWLDDRFWTVTFAPAVGLGVSLTWSAQGLQVYASRPNQRIVAVAWGPLSPRGWTDWVCFDEVQLPNRVSATNLDGFSPEIFVTTTNWKLYVRTAIGSDGAWGPWSVVTPPSQAPRITDVHVVGGAPTRVYVADSGHVYRSERTSNAPPAPYGEWRWLGSPDAELVAAGVQKGDELVFVVDATGAVRSSVNPNGSSGEWNVVPTDGPAIDLDVGYTPGGTPTLYVLERDGALKSSVRLSEDVWSPWVLLKESAQAPSLKSITVFHHLDEDLVFAIDADGRVKELRDNGWHPVGAN